jgi:hypothetical protein
MKYEGTTVNLQADVNLNHCQVHGQTVTSVWYYAAFEEDLKLVVSSKHKWMQTKFVLCHDSAESHIAAAII